MTGVRLSLCLHFELEAGQDGRHSAGRSEIILSKLDLDNTSERTCVTFDCSPFAVCWH